MLILLNDSCFVCTTWYHHISAPVPQLKPLGPTPALFAFLLIQMPQLPIPLACVALQINVTSLTRLYFLFAFLCSSKASASLSANSFVLT